MILMKILFGNYRGRAVCFQGGLDVPFVGDTCMLERRFLSRSGPMRHDTVFCKVVSEFSDMARRSNLGTADSVPNRQLHSTKISAVRSSKARRDPGYAITHLQHFSRTARFIWPVPIRPRTMRTLSSVPVVGNKVRFVETLELAGRGETAD